MNKFDIKIKIFKFKIFDNNVQYRLKFIINFFNILIIIKFQIISNNWICVIINNFDKKIITIKSQLIFNIFNLIIIIKIEFQNRNKN